MFLQFQSCQKIESVPGNENLQLLPILNFGTLAEFYRRVCQRVSCKFQNYMEMLKKIVLVFPKGALRIEKYPYEKAKWLSNFTFPFCRTNSKSPSEIYIGAIILVNVGTKYISL